MNRICVLGTLCLILLFSSVESFAAPKKPGVPLVCDTVFQAPGLSADKIYDNLKAWFAQRMRSANDVIQLDDKENHHIIGKAVISMEVKNLTWSCLTGRIRFMIDIAARDGRYRVLVSGFEHETDREGWSEGPVYVNGPNPNIKGLRKKQNSEMQKRAVPLCIDALASIFVTLQQSMEGKSNIVDDDW